MGGGLVGLTLALDLAQRGVAVVLLDDDDTRQHRQPGDLHRQAHAGDLRPARPRAGACWPRASPGTSAGCSCGDRELFGFDLLPEDGHEYPAFINLQQYYAEEWLVEACAATGLVDLRWAHRGDRGRTPRRAARPSRSRRPGGDYALPPTGCWPATAPAARCAGRWTCRSSGRVFRDRFLIADVVMQAPFPTERRFWFDPPFHPQPVGAAAQAAGRRLADRPAARLGRRPGGGAPAGTGHPPRPGDAGAGCPVRAGMGQRLHLPLPPAGALRARPGRVRGRQRPPGQPVRRPRRQWRRAGCGQPGLEAGGGAAWRRAGRADRQLRRRAHPGRRREHPAQHAGDRFHLAEVGGGAGLSRCGAAAGRGPCVRPRDGELGAAVAPMPSCLRGAAAATPGPAHRSPGSPAIDAPVRNEGRPDWLLRHIGGPCFTLLLFGDERPMLPAGRPRPPAPARRGRAGGRAAASRRSATRHPLAPASCSGRTSMWRRCSGSSTPAGVRPRWTQRLQRRWSRHEARTRTAAAGPGRGVSPPWSPPMTASTRRRRAGSMRALVLLLANHIGEDEVVLDAIRIARRTGENA